MKKLHIAALLAVVVGFHNISRAQTPDSPGAQSYAKRCAICHGDNREGILPGFPPLVEIKRQLSEQQIAGIIHTGKGRMPAFPKLQNEELTALLRFLAADNLATPAHESNNIAETGRHVFQRNCAFCHGRDAAGGETGPDLTRSKLVLADRDGSKITEVVRNGRPEKKMPAFNFSTEEIRSIVAFIHATQAQASAHPGKRRGVDVADLQTGNVETGKQYFNGTGGCSKCHSATGDLAGIASRFEGLQLEERMLYPKNTTSHVIVTLPSGEKITGVLAYLDEFTVGLRDKDGTYHSWPVSRVRYIVDAPVEAHVELFSKYTDDDIHNLMAYLQTLR
jgi:mono/diheme cytochrome c family protein